MTVDPLFVWDTNEPGYFRSPLREEAFAWAVAHCGADDDVHRIEFYVRDRSFASVHRYALNENGRRYLDPVTGEAAQLEPVTVVLSELPPAHLRYDR